MNEEDLLLDQMTEEQMVRFNTYYQSNFLHSFQLSPKDSFMEVKQMQSEAPELTL